MQSKEFEGRSSECKKETPWLASEDILDAGEVVVEVEKIWRHKEVPFDDGRKEDVLALQFKGKQKQLVMNATNRKMMVYLTGTTKVKEWIGKKVVLWVDRNVRKPGGKRGETTFGIRIKGEAA